VAFRSLCHGLFLESDRSVEKVKDVASLLPAAKEIE